MLRAQAVQSAAEKEERSIATNPTYSSALHQHKPPEDWLATWEEKLSAASDEGERFTYLPFAAKAALEAGQNNKARAYAEEALRFLPRDPFPFIHRAGNTVFDCNFVLGRLALLDGDVALAEEYLLLAGDTKGSIVLDTSGPNMSLARELLKRSRRETVLKFLAQCGRFWTDDHGLLAKWSAEIENGEMPVFGTNLFY